MRTKHLLTLAAVIAAATYATSAQAGVSVQLSLGWPGPVYVESGYGAHVVVAPPPRRVSCPPPVYAPPRCVQVYQPVRVPPGHARKYYRPSKHRSGKYYGHGRRHYERSRACGSRWR